MHKMRIEECHSLSALGFRDSRHSLLPTFGFSSGVDYRDYLHRFTLENVEHLKWKPSDQGTTSLFVDFCVTQGILFDFLDICSLAASIVGLSLLLVFQNVPGLTFAGATGKPYDGNMALPGTSVERWVWTGPNWKAVSGKTACTVRKG